MFKHVWSKLIYSIRSFQLPVQENCIHRILGFIFLGLMSRLLPHPPNFTAMNAIALFGISSFGNLGMSLFSIFSIMLLSDLVYSFHSSMIFVYLSFTLIALLGYGLQSKRSLLRTTILLSTSSFLFFIITNFGIWLSGSMYPKTVAGLGLCYLAAIPFSINNLLGTFFYGSILYCWLELAESKRHEYLIIK